MPSTYIIRDWKKQDTISRSPIWKIIFYDLLRPWLSKQTSNYISKNTLDTFSPTWVLPERGFPLETRRRWATNNSSLHGKTILVQGTGTGWDVISWARLKPAKIVATDLFSFTESWNEISVYCHQRFGVEVCFYQAPLEDHSFLDNESFDLCASDAVYEHCTHLPQVILETYRVLKADGYVYATYGPLWFCASGNHLERGGLENVYNHLMLDEYAYKQYLNSNRYENEEFQSGYRYTELGLFSYLTTSEYLEIFKIAGFIVDDLIFEVSSKATKFSINYPEKFNEMVKKYSQRCERDDFFIKANFIRLKKKKAYQDGRM